MGGNFLEKTDFKAHVLDVVQNVPSGKIVTYGQVAILAGFSNHARHVARILRQSNRKIPWHRVVGARAKERAQISILDTLGAFEQRHRLESEGVFVDEHMTISIQEFGWLPIDFVK